MIYQAADIYLNYKTYGENIKMVWTCGCGTRLDDNRVHSTVHTVDSQTEHFSRIFHFEQDEFGIEAKASTHGGSISRKSQSNDTLYL